MTQFNPNTDALTRIDAGEFDNASPSTVLSLLGEWSKDQPGISDLRFFREVVTQLWVINQSEKNGEPVFAIGGPEFVGDEPVQESDNLCFSLELTPDIVRRALVAGLEASIAERYDSAHAEGEILRFYLLMLDAGQGLTVILSPFGVEVLTDIFTAILMDNIGSNTTEVTH